MKQRISVIGKTKVYRFNSKTNLRFFFFFIIQRRCFNSYCMALWHEQFFFTLLLPIFQVTKQKSSLQAKATNIRSLVSPVLFLFLHLLFFLLGLSSCSLVTYILDSCITFLLSHLKFFFFTNTSLFPLSCIILL